MQHDKPIHQPGTLRKVSIYICKFCSCIDTIIILQHVRSSELGSIVLNAPGLGNTTSLYDLTLLLPPGITLSTIGHFAQAIVGADGKVINLCDLVVYTVEKRYSVSCNTCLQLFIYISHFQLETGTFCGSFQAEIGTFCVIRHMEPIVDAQQKPVFNSFNFPLLLRTNKIRLVPAACLNHAVSVVHQCDSRC